AVGATRRDWRSAYGAGTGGPGLLGLHGTGALHEGGLEGVPGERGALDPHRKLPHAGKDRELAQFVEIGGLLAGCREHRLKASEKPERLDHTVLADGFGHQRCRCLRNRASAAGEPHVADDIGVNAHLDMNPIAAERVVALGLTGRIRQGPEVPRPSIVVENQFLVELGQVRHQYLRRTRAGAWPPPTSGPCPTAAPRRPRQWPPAPREAP